MELRSKIWGYSAPSAQELVIEDGVDVPMDRDNPVIPDRVDIPVKRKQLEQKVRHSRLCKCKCHSLNNSPRARPDAKMVDMRIES